MTTNIPSTSLPQPGAPHSVQQHMQDEVDVLQAKIDGGCREVKRLEMYAATSSAGAAEATTLAQAASWQSLAVTVSSPAPATISVSLNSVGAVKW